VVTTCGLRKNGESNIAEITRVNGHAQAYNGVDVAIYAKCTGVTTRKNISLTGSTLWCNKGEGISVTMSKPIDPNIDKYHGVIIRWTPCPDHFYIKLRNKFKIQTLTC
jgi:hypothetical protein